MVIRGQDCVGRPKPTVRCEEPCNAIDIQTLLDDLIQEGPSASHPAQCIHVRRVRLSTEIPSSAGSGSGRAIWLLLLVDREQNFGSIDHGRNCYTRLREL